MNKKSKIAVIASLSVMVVIAGATAVTAYFTSMNNKDNTIKIAKNTIEVSEQFTPLPQQEVGENVYQKEIRIANTGNSPCYIRVYADFSDDDIRSRSYLSNDSDKDSATFYSASRSLDSTDSVVTFPEYVNDQGSWVFVPDDDSTKLAGYYYYLSPVPAGQSTLPLFTYVKTENPTDQDIQQYDIVVYAESIQLTDKTGEAYETYRQAWLDYLSRTE